MAEEPWWYPQLAVLRRGGLASVRRSGAASAGDGSNVNTGVQVIVQEAASPPARSAYRQIVEQVFPGQLVDREAELRELAEYCAKADAPSYLWLQGPAWAGKSALMASFVLAPPAGIRVVSFFVTARWAGQSDRAAFLEAVLTQLAEVAGQPLPDVLTESNRQGWFGQFLEAAAATSERDGTRLVLAIDGLDEDSGVTVGADAHSIAALLPARPPRGVRVIVAGRPDPPVPSDVPSWHPLRNPAVIRQLTISPKAIMARDDAERELARLLSDDTLGRDLLGLMVASGGGLSGADLADLTGRSPWEIGQVLKSVSGRSFTGRNSLWQGSRTPVFVLAHEELRRTAIEGLGSQVVDGFRNRLHAWADRYRHEKWPSTTPEYLLRDYPRMLRSAGDLPRMQGLATDRARLDRMLDVSGGDAAALAEVVAVLEYTRRQSDPDLTAVLRLAVTRDRLTSRNRKIPSGLLTSWVALGNPSRAEALARSVTDPSEQTTNLTTLAKALIQAGDLKAARQVAYQAESAARLIEANLGRLMAWALLVEVWARTGDHKTADRARQVKAVVDHLTDEYRRAAAVEAERSRDRIAEVTTYFLAHVLFTYDDTMAVLARAQAMAGDIDGARSTVRAIHNTFNSSLQAEALASLVEAITMAGDLDQAEKVARAIPPGYAQVQALTTVALAITRTRKTPAEAQRLLAAAEGAVSAITWPVLQVRALVSIVEIMATTGALNRARDLTRRAETAAESMEEESRLAVSAELVRALVKLGDVKGARQLAHWVRTTIDLVASGNSDAHAQAMERMVAVSIEIGDLDQARLIAQQIEDLVRVEASPEQEAQARQHLAAALARAGDLEGARGIVETLDDRARDHGLTVLAEVLSDMDNLKQAEDVILSVVEPGLRTFELAGLAGKRIKRGEFERARAVLDRALTAVSSISYEYARDTSLSRLAEALERMGDYNRADDILQRISDRRTRDRLLGKLAEICAGNGEMERAEAMLGSANLEDPFERVDLSPVAAAMVRGGDPDRAARWASDPRAGVYVSIALIKALAETGDLDRAERLTHAITSRSAKVEALTTLMESSARAGAPNRFMELAELAESTARSTSDPVKWACSLLTCAEAFARTGNIRAAERIIQEADSIAWSTDDQRMKQPILCALVRPLLEVNAYDRAAAVALSINDSIRQLEAATLVVDKSDLQCSRRLLASILVVADPIPYLDLLAKVEPRVIHEAVRYLPIAIKNDVNDLA